jgi:hypothetical protein
MKALHKNFERNEKILEQKNLGGTYKSIGLEFGLSREQTKTILIRHERLKFNMKRGGVFLLSSRAQCVIKNHSYDDDLDWSFESLIKIPNCGPKTTEEILEHIEGLRKPAMSPTKNFERNEKILEQRNLGRTLKSIGDEFGLSGTQIRLICFLHERLKIHIEKHPEGNFLSTMAQNIIRTHEYNDDFELSYKYLIKKSGCGAKTAREILNYFNIEEKVNEMPYKVRLTGQRQRTYAHKLIDAAPDYSIVIIVGDNRAIDLNKIIENFERIEKEAG